MISVEKNRKDVIDDAFRLASDWAREEFLADPRLELTRKQSILMRAARWSPYESRYDFQPFGMRVKLQDPVVKKIRLTPELNDRLEEIVVEAYKEVITNRQVKPFLTNLLQDLVGDESYYGQYNA